MGKCNEHKDFDGCYSEMDEIKVDNDLKKVQMCKWTEEFMCISNRRDHEGYLDEESFTKMLKFCIEHEQGEKCQAEKYKNSQISKCVWLQKGEIGLHLSPGTNSIKKLSVKP